MPSLRARAEWALATELGVITNGAVTTDCVANDSTYLGTFPYLGDPN